jgi:uncharacterized C2H2 Zn-finger protein
MNQLDGSSEGRGISCESGPALAFKVLTGPVCGSLQFVANALQSADSDANATPSAAGTSATRPGESTVAAPPTGVSQLRQIKRERSDSNDSSDGGDRPTKKSHQCQYCNKLFANSFRLKIHVRVHTGEKPFHCEPCNQAFSDRSNFVKHKQTKTHRQKADLSAAGGTASTLSEQASRLRDGAETAPVEGPPSSGVGGGHPFLVSCRLHMFPVFLFKGAVPPVGVGLKVVPFDLKEHDEMNI